MALLFMLGAVRSGRAVGGQLLVALLGGTASIHKLLGCFGLKVPANPSLKRTCLRHAAYLQLSRLQYKRAMPSRAQHSKYRAAASLQGQAVPGLPSFGGRRAAAQVRAGAARVSASLAAFGGPSFATLLAVCGASRCAAAQGNSSFTGQRTANPAVKRTCLRHAAYLQR
jgi:hypothetical protein